MDKETTTVITSDLLDKDQGTINNVDSSVLWDIEPDKAAERRLCRKLDLQILPWLTLMYLCNSLDRGNVANAKTDGLDTDLGMHGNQYNIMLSVFFIPDVVFAFPITLLCKRYNPANGIPIMAFGFGVMSVLTACVKNWGGIMAIRWFVGVFEGALLPSVIYYFTMFYRRNELAGRLSIMFSMSGIANAFSGLLSFGVFQIPNSKLKGWQYLFLIEGGMTVVIAVLAFVLLPRSIDGAKFFTEEEKKLAKYRVQTDSSVVVGEKLSFKKAVKVFHHPVTIGWILGEIFLGVPLYSIGNWFPQIVQNLGKSVVETNLLTVAPNVSGSLILLILAFSSDWLRVRSFFVMFSLLVTMIGVVVFGCLDPKIQTGGAYFSCFLMTAGTSASSVLMSTWYNNNNPCESRRVVLSAVAVPLANASGLISTNIFLPKDAPKYLPALITTACFGAAGILVIGITVAFMIYDNHRRNRIQGVNYSHKDVSTADLGEGPKNPNFRWMY